MECDQPSLIFTRDVTILNFECDVCLQPGRELYAYLGCRPQTRRISNCTIRNPDGLPAHQLVDGKRFNYVDDFINFFNLSHEDSDLPTVLGEWTCTCVNQDGVSKATISIGECRKLV